VEIFAAFFTEVFIGTHSFIHDADTATMLPDLTRIALDEHTANLIRQQIRCICGRIHTWIILDNRFVQAPRGW
jgi:hypothetical protein